MTAKDHPDERYRTPRRVKIDGHWFDIVARADEPGAYDYVWISGPHDGYGFSSHSASGNRLEMLDHVNAVRNFLTEINYETGYID